MNRPKATPVWPWVVFGIVMVGLTLTDLLTWWQYHVGYVHPYNYWIETTVGTLGYAVVGLLISTRVPGNLLGPLMLGLACASNLQDFTGVLALTAVHAGAPDALIAALGGGFSSGQILSVGLALLLLQLAPSGRPLNRRWALAAKVFAGSLAALAIGLFLQGPGEGSLDGYPYGLSVAPDAMLPWLNTTVGALQAVILLGIALGVISLGLRWFRASGEARSQVTWVVIGGIAGPAIIIVDGLISHWVQGPLHGSLVWAAASAALPTGIAIAVFRHGLYDLDRVVSRTVSYTLVSGTLLLIYVAIVSAVSLLPVSGSFAVAAATLSAAAAFRPVLQRVRTGVDRRFDRTRYNGEALVAEYARELQRAVDITSVGSGLTATVRQAVSPTSVTLWLRSDA